MYVWHRETEANWEKELEEDVREECCKFGAVESIQLIPTSKVRREVVLMWEVEHRF